MTEADLDILLNRAGRRLRLEHAIKKALLAFGICLLVAAAVVLWARLTAASSPIILAALLAPPLSAFMVWLLVYWRYRPAMRYVALLLDRRAGTAEHLVTWHELRCLPAEALNELQRGFRAAQRACTLQRVDGCNARRLVPIRFPEWSRSLGLAVLLLCCALLVPPPPPAPADSVSQGGAAAGKQFAHWQTEPLGSMATGNVDAPRVQVLSPTENMLYCLELTDPGKSLEEKAALLKKLESKLGGLPIKALSPELQQACNEIRQQLDKKNAAQAKTEASASQTTVAENPDRKIPIHTPGGPANIVEFKEKAITDIRQHYADVQEPLERYYKALVSGR